MRLRFFLSLSIFVFCIACNLTRKTGTFGHIKNTKDSVLPAIVVQPEEYHPAAKRIFDLLHTRLEVRLDYTKSQLKGKATLTLKPYFYPTSQLELDAKGQDIKEVSILVGTERKQASYSYEKDKVKIQLGKEYTREDTLVVYIEYVAKPNELATKNTGGAITESRGLYFINPENKIPDVPVQVWTQGETESASCWFPTIDAPNERMTQEIYLTVDTAYATLSNGLLEYGQDNGDGTRTDYWKQSLPAAPYLSMIAVGNFAVVKDKWNDIEVSYFVEPAYEKHARMIFGNTPEMLEFFSNQLGVPFAWEKYSQVVVRDYVSGAMENTTAVIHGVFLQRDEREYLDNTNEDVIAHELFHHWFGDLVTCESWSNLPLNESFATYGEYLWNEKKYGLDAAAYGLQNDLNAYLNLPGVDHEPIWFEYRDKEEMFDNISYQKGGRILHMLRNYVGDEAFFTALKNYLNTHKFSSVEIHDLRLAFEKVTGEDLNWFFNQWFFKAGHPDLDISYSYDDSLKKQTVQIRQVQSVSTGNKLVYKLPMSIDIYAGGKTTRHKIVLEKMKDRFTFDVASRPDLVNTDADKMLLCTKRERKLLGEWVYQYEHAPRYLDRYEAIVKIGELAKEDSLGVATIVKALDDPFWAIRSLAIRNAVKISLQKDVLKNKIEKLARNDEKSHVRALALEFIGKDGADTSAVPLFREALKDRSYKVAGTALEELAKVYPDSALMFAKPFEKEKSASMIFSVAEVYTKRGGDAQQSYFENAFSNFKDKVRSNERYWLMSIYTRFLEKCTPPTIDKGVAIIEQMAKNEAQQDMRLAAAAALLNIVTNYDQRELDLQEKLSREKDPSRKAALEKERQEIVSSKAGINAKIQAIEAAEKDKK